MALTGLQIYKLLPQTNCKECGQPTCLAFAMKLAAKQAELKQCPYVTEQAKAQLEAASAPPIRLVTGAGEAPPALTQIRRLALKKNFRALGHPVITFPGEANADEMVLAAQHIAKYAGFVVLEAFDPATAYPLLVLRQNIFTDPQKPIQVQPGLYEINSPDASAPLMVTTNFSITYFAVNNEVEGSGWPGWLLVADAG